MIEGPKFSVHLLLPSQLVSPGGPVTVLGAAPDDVGTPTTEVYVGKPVRGAVNVTDDADAGGAMLYAAVFGDQLWLAPFGTGT